MRLLELEQRWFDNIMARHCLTLDSLRPAHYPPGLSAWLVHRADSQQAAKHRRRVLPRGAAFKRLAKLESLHAGGIQ